MDNIAHYEENGLDALQAEELSEALNELTSEVEYEVAERDRMNRLDMIAEMERDDLEF